MNVVAARWRTTAAGASSVRERGINSQHRVTVYGDVNANVNADVGTVDLVWISPLVLDHIEHSFRVIQQFCAVTPVEKSRPDLLYNRGFDNMISSAWPYSVEVCLPSPGSTCIGDRDAFGDPVGIVTRNATFETKT